MAIERDQLAARIVGDPGAAAWAYVPSGADNYPGGGARADFAGWPLARRQAEARRLLGQAGHAPARPLRVRLAFAGSDQNRKLAVISKRISERLARGCPARRERRLVSAESFERSATPQLC
jgi:ABC-type oligopeptide transport system substrate-binding subunit